MLEKVYGFLANKCKINVIPSKAIKVLEGELVISASTAGSANINYPSGFNASNCVPISMGILGNVEAKGYNYIGTYTDSSDGLSNSFRRRLNLTEDNITLVIFNPNTAETTMKYRLVLMRTDL